MSAPTAPSHDCSLSVLGLCVLYHIWCSVCVLVILCTARNAGVHKSSLGLSTLRTQGLVNEPFTKMWKRCTRNWRKKCTRNQETPRSAACPRRCRACVLDEHLQPHPLALSNVSAAGDTRLAGLKNGSFLTWRMMN